MWGDELQVCSFKSIDAKATVPAAKQKSTWPVHTHTLMLAIFINQLIKQDQTRTCFFFWGWAVLTKQLDSMSDFREARVLYRDWAAACDKVDLEALGHETCPQMPNFHGSLLSNQLIWLVPKVHDFFDIFWIQALHTVYSTYLLEVGTCSVPLALASP